MPWRHVHVVTYVDNYLSGAGIGRSINFVSIVLTDKVLEQLAT